MFVLLVLEASQIPWPSSKLAKLPFSDPSSVTTPHSAFPFCLPLLVLKLLWSLKITRPTLLTRTDLHWQVSIPFVTWHSWDDYKGIFGAKACCIILTIANTEENSAHRWQTWRQNGQTLHQKLFWNYQNPFCQGSCRLGTNQVVFLVLPSCQDRSASPLRLFLRVQHNRTDFPVLAFGSSFFKHLNLGSGRGFLFF